ncbi:MAG: hypothetical protein K2N16_09155 [Muribaculaceae bacterium]|nr:hypothetical protein [Muribaculaceae bacterium]
MSNPTQYQHQPYGQQSNQQHGQQYNQQNHQQYNQQYSQPYGQQPYGQQTVQSYGQPYGPGVPQVIFVNASPAPVPAPEPKPSNGVGKAGFILAIISVCVGWLPYGGIAVWFVGFLLSFIGVFKNPKGFAVAGLIISLVALVEVIIAFTLLAAALGEIFR